MFLNFSKSEFDTSKNEEVKYNPFAVRSESSSSSVSEFLIPDVPKKGKKGKKNTIIKPTKFKKSKPKPLTKVVIHTKFDPEKFMNVNSIIQDGKFTFELPITKPSSNFDSSSLFPENFNPLTLSEFTAISNELESKVRPGDIKRKYKKKSKNSELVEEFTLDTEDI
ncbi:hypothetical protein [Carp edema virus]|nr:hypothetical protein [Carp edema virus]